MSNYSLYFCVYLKLLNIESLFSKKLKHISLAIGLRIYWEIAKMELMNFDANLHQTDTGRIREIGLILVVF